jgi:hypothetical protein
MLSPPPPRVNDFYVLEVAIGTLQQNVGTFHGAIWLNCHSNENNRMTFHMITTTHVYCPIMHNACPITSVACPATCYPNPLHTINEKNLISNMMQVSLDC